MIAVLCTPRQTFAAAVATPTYRRGPEAQPFHPISCQPGGFVPALAGS
jgi:hypothetical protein